MKRNRLITLCMMLFVIFSFTGMAIAANNVVLKTTVPNRPQTSCEQAGTITQEWDSGTTIQEGDAILFTLRNGITVCKSIDFFLKLANDGSDPTSNLTTDPVSDNDSSAGNDYFHVVDSTGTKADAADGDNVINNLWTNGADDNSDYEVGFKVAAGVGAQTVTLTLSRHQLSGTDAQGHNRVFAATATADKFVLSFNSNDPSTKLSVKLFDKKYDANWFHKRDTGYSSGPAYPQYDATMQDVDNVLCINLTNGQEYEPITPDSTHTNVAYTLSFSGDYYIVHVTGSDAFTVTTACKDACPTFWLTPKVTQSGITTTPADFIDPSVPTITGSSATTSRFSSTASNLAGGTSLMCSPATGNGIKAYRSTNFEASSQYTMKLTLLRNGTTANNDIVWWVSSDITTGNGASTAASGTNSRGLAGTSYGYFRINEGEAKACFQTEALTNNALTWVTDDTTNRKTNIYTTGLVAGASGSEHSEFLLDIPGFYLDYTKLSDGDTISVLATFGKQPCGGSVTGTICLATAVSQCTTAGCYTLVYPWATGGSNSDFWSGLAVTNLDMASTCTATVRLYDSAGGSGSLQVVLTPNGQYINTIQGIMGATGYTNGSTAVDSTLNLYVQVQGNTKMDGVVFVGGVTNSVLHGYLPRVYTCSSTSAYSAVVH